MPTFGFYGIVPASRNAAHDWLGWCYRQSVFPLICIEVTDNALCINGHQRSSTMKPPDNHVGYLIHELFPYLS